MHDKLNLFFIDKLGYQSIRPTAELLTEPSNAVLFFRSKDDSAKNHIIDDVRQSFSLECDGLSLGSVRYTR